MLFKVISSTKRWWPLNSYITYYKALEKGNIGIIDSIIGSNIKKINKGQIIKKYTTKKETINKNIYVRENELFIISLYF